MSDYIKRNDVLRIMRRAFDFDYDEATAVENLPAADVVEIVRCKDCKYGEENCKSPIYGMWCKRFGAEKSYLAVLPTDYCSYGERKEK